MRPFAVIIPHYGEEALLADCLAALEAWEAWIGCVHVIDNNDANVGFTRACNQGIARELERPTGEHLLLLNNDCAPHSDPFAPLYARLDEPAAGVVSPMNVDHDDHDRILWGGGLDVNPGVHKAGSVRLGNWSEPSRETWTSFSVVAIRREVFRDVGLLDERFRNVASDSDLSLRARSSGWDVWYEPGSVWAHRLTHSAATDTGALRDKGRDITRFNESNTAQQLFQLGGELLVVTSPAGKDEVFDAGPRSLGHERHAVTQDGMMPLLAKGGG